MDHVRREAALEQQSGRLDARPLTLCDVVQGRAPACRRDRRIDRRIDERRQVVPPELLDAVIRPGEFVLGTDLPGEAEHPLLDVLVIDARRAVGVKYTGRYV